MKKSIKWTVFILVCLGIWKFFFGFSVPDLPGGNSDLLKTINTVLIGAVCLTVALFVAVLLKMKKIKLDKMKEVLEKAHLPKKLPWATVIGFIAVNIALWYSFTEWYKETWSAHWVLIIATISAVIILKGRWRIAVIGLLIIGPAVELYNEKQSLHKSRMAVRREIQNSGRIDTKSIPLPEINNPNCEGKVRDFWTEHAPQDADTMVKIVHRESGCNHFEKDKNIALVGRIDPDDRGLHQINLRWWNAEAQTFPDRDVLGQKISSLNPLSEDDNYMAALYLYQRYGLQPWKTSLEKGPQSPMGTVIFVSAPVGEWSREVAMGPTGRFTWEMMKPKKASILVNGNKDIKLDPTKNERLELGTVKTLRFMSGEDEPFLFKITLF